MNFTIISDNVCLIMQKVVWKGHLIFCQVKGFSRCVQFVNFENMLRIFLYGLKSYFVSEFELEILPVCRGSKFTNCEKAFRPGIKSLAEMFLVVIWNTIDK